MERSPDTFNNNLVKATGNTPWTHCGIVWLDRETNKANLIEITLELDYHVAPIGEHYEKVFKDYSESDRKQSYMAYRPLQQTLTDEQLDKFEQGMEALKNKPYDETADQFGAGCDCCDCLPFCGEELSLMIMVVI